LTNKSHGDRTAAALAQTKSTHAHTSASIKSEAVPAPPRKKQCAGDSNLTTKNCTQTSQSTTKLSSTGHGNTNNDIKKSDSIAMPSGATNDVVMKSATLVMLSATMPQTGATTLYMVFTPTMNAPMEPRVAKAFSKVPRVSFVSAGQLCDLRTRPVLVASRTAIYGFSTITDDATALR